MFRDAFHERLALSFVGINCVILHYGHMLGDTKCASTAVPAANIICDKLRGTILYQSTKVIIVIQKVFAICYCFIQILYSDSRIKIKSLCVVV